MLALRIDLLTGRYAASEYNDRDLPEWPPHPARLFSALVATWGEGSPGTEDGDAELAALRWLELQPAPEILATSRKELLLDKRGGGRVIPVFVPVNDVGVIKQPDRDKLDDLDREIAGSDDPKARAKLDKQRAKLVDKLATEVAKAIAPPARIGKTEPDDAESMLPERRGRQPRAFASVAPEVPAFAFVWPTASPEPGVERALARLTARLVRLGHSSSLVHARWIGADDVRALANATTLHQPDERSGRLVLRWVSPGQVERLVRVYRRHQEVEPRVLPAAFVRYRDGAERAGSAAVHSDFDPELIVFERDVSARNDADAEPDVSAGASVSLTSASAAGLAKVLRAALMSVADQPVPEILSGHKPDRGPSERAHLAIVPLPSVLGRYADGSLLGLALVLPRDATTEERSAVMRAVGQLEVCAEKRRRAEKQRRAERGEVVDDNDDGDGRPSIVLHLGRSGDLVLRRDAWQEATRATVQARTWTRPSRAWASATPVALDRNPGELHAEDPAKRAAAFEAARASIAEAVQRIGLPAPTEIDVVRSCVLPGTLKPRAFPRFPIDPRKPQRVLVHVRLVFAHAIEGPVLIGAGRYHGLGLCLPVGEG